MGKKLWTAVCCIMGTACQSTQSTPPTQNSGDFENAKGTKRKSSLGRILKQIENDSFHKKEIPTAFLFAEALNNKRKYNTAQKLYGAIFNATPTLTAGLKTASSMLQTGKMDKAQLVLEKLQTIYPNDSRPSILSAQVSLKSGGVQEGFQKIKSVHERFPEDPLVKLQYIQSLLQLKQAEKALEELNEAVKKFPSNSRFAISLARIHIRKGQYEDAEKTLKNFLQYSPDHFEALRLCGRIALQTNDYEKAEKFLETAYVKRPYDNSVVRDYALALIQNNKNTEARRVLTKVQGDLKLERHLDAELALRYGTVLLQLNQPQKAEKIFTELSKKRPFQKNFYNYFLASSLEEQNKRPEALKLYESIPVGDLMGKRSLQSRINILASQGSDETAYKLLENYPLDREDAQDYRFYISLLLKLKKFDDALRVNAEAKKFHTKSASLHYQTAVILEKKEGENSFLKSVEGVVKQFPNYAPALNHFAYTLVVKKKRLDYAVELLQKAVELEPRNGYYLDSLGWAYFQKNSLAKAHR